MKYINVPAILLLMAVACKQPHQERDKKTLPAATIDSASLIQAVYHSTLLYDTLFKQQFSQQPILYKDSALSARYHFTYRDKKVAIEKVNFDRHTIDFQHPRFLIVLGPMKQKGDSAEVNFTMPDVGLGVQVKLFQKNQQWTTTGLDIEHY